MDGWMDGRTDGWMHLCMRAPACMRACMHACIPAECTQPAASHSLQYICICMLCVDYVMLDVCTHTFLYMCSYTSISICIMYVQYTHTHNDMNVVAA